MQMLATLTTSLADCKINTREPAEI